MKRHVKKRHKFYFSALRPVGVILNKTLNFKCSPIKFKKGEQYLIMSNHQTTLDPAFICMQFKAPLYIMANDTIFNRSIPSRLMQHCFAPIKKRKATVDVGCIKTCLQVAKDGGSIMIFPEGNRSWYDNQFYIDNSVCKLVRLLKLPLILYNFCGGYGVNPRWGAKKRKGKFYGKVNKILSVEEINGLTDDQLYSIIKEGIRVKDTQNGNQYTSKRRAEYLERLLFLCPKCGKVHTLKSVKEKVICSSCGFSATYNVDLTLSGAEEYNITTLYDWHKQQTEYIANLSPVPDKILFHDEKVKLYDKTTDKKILLKKGDLYMTDKVIEINGETIFIHDILSATVVGGINLVINTKDGYYIIKGNKRFNAIKYLLSFNILSSTYKDDYYGLRI